MSLPETLYDVAATRALDETAIEQAGIPGLTLMRRAGQAAFDTLLQTWPDVRRLAVVCGTGNNGGDGFVIAELAHAAGLAVDVTLVGDPQRLRGDAASCFDAMRAAGVEPAAGPFRAGAADAIVDALFGIGLDRDLGGEHAETVAAINAADAPVLSVDVPSGIEANTGRRLGIAVVAAVTVTFIGVKQGLLTGDAPNHCGLIRYADLGVPAEVFARVAATARAAGFANLRHRLEPRARVAHKGHYGHVLVVGGAPGYGGAARMCGEAAARTGAGLVSIATHPSHAATVTRARPELMCHAVADRGDLTALLRAASVVALGPGLGQSEWSRAMFAAARATRLPVVMDADALNLLASDPDDNPARVITPHPGEAARLLRLDTAAVQADRFAAARALVESYGGVAVLKGAGTVISTRESVPRIVTDGNPGMASGGMGDVLTGIIAGLIAQGLPLPDAAVLGAAVHGHAADRAVAVDGERGLLAMDLMPHLRRALND